jgi:hypothetical protein
MDIQRLTASDFPGIDERKFNEWKPLQIKANRILRWAWYIWAGQWAIADISAAQRGLTAAFSPIYVAVILAVPGLVLNLIVYAVIRIKYRRMFQLREELMISERLKAKKKGRPFTG